jgi:hypothetical protein
MRLRCARFLGVILRPPLRPMAARYFRISAVILIVPPRWFSFNANKILHSRYVVKLFLKDFLFYL